MTAPAVALWVGEIDPELEATAGEVLQAAGQPLVEKGSPRRRAEFSLARALAVRLGELEGASDSRPTYSHSFSARQPPTTAVGAALTRAAVPVGLDLEWTTRPGIDPVALARRAFAPTEALWFDNLADAEKKRELFFHLWTLREALAKALSIGLAGARKRLQLQRQDGQLQLSIDGQAQPDWHWRHFRPTADLLLAVVWPAPTAQTCRLHRADHNLNLTPTQWPPSTAEILF